LRHFFIKGVETQLKVQEEMLAKFNEEREFFLQNAQKGQKNTLHLENKIRELKLEIEDEKNYNIRMLAEEQATILC
jgi:hypothetical protein